MQRLVSLSLAALALGACTTPLNLGEECTDSADCMDGLSCFFTDRTRSRSVCMSDCDDTMTRVCDMGEACIPAMLMDVPRDEEVCFLGGPTPVGSVCMDTFDCVRGAVCVSISGAQTCYRACSTADGTECLSNETCQGLIGEPISTNGYCAPNP